MSTKLDAKWRKTVNIDENVKRKSARRRKRKERLEGEKQMAEIEGMTED